MLACILRVKSMHIACAHRPALGHLQNSLKLAESSSNLLRVKAACFQSLCKVCKDFSKASAGGTSNVSKPANGMTSVPGVPSGCVFPELDEFLWHGRPEPPSGKVRE